MLPTMPTSCYWCASIAINAVYVVALSIVLYSQYQYISQDSVPTDLGKFVEQAAWQLNIASFRSVLFGDALATFISQIFFISLIGFSLIPRLWERFRTFCKTRLTDYLDPAWESIHAGIFYFLFLLFSLAVQRLALVPFNLYSYSPLHRLVQDFTIEFLSSIPILGLLEVTRRRKIFTMAIIGAVIIGYGLISNLYSPGNYLQAHDKLLDEDTNSSYLNLLARVGFPAERANILYGDAKSYLMGWGQFTVLFIGDQLRARGLPTRLSEAAAAHQLAFWNYNFEFIKSLVSFLGQFSKIFGIFCIIDRPKFYQSFGFKESEPISIGIGLILYELLSRQMQFFSAPLMNIIGWAMAIKADSFAASLGYGQDMLQYLKELGPTYGNNPLMTRLYGLFYSEYPVFADRIFNL